jgi:hypothetical protein
MTTNAKPRNLRNTSAGLAPHSSPLNYGDAHGVNDFQDAVENASDTSDRTEANAVRAMGERPLGFQLVTQAKKYSRRHIYHHDSNSAGFRKLASAVSDLVLSGRHPSGSVPTEQSALLGANDEHGEKQEQIALWEALADIIFGKWVSIFLVLIPFCFLAKHLQWPPIWIFWLNFFVMIPLAAILGTSPKRLPRTQIK